MNYTFLRNTPFVRYTNLIHTNNLLPLFKQLKNSKTIIKIPSYLKVNSDNDISNKEKINTAIKHKLAQTYAKNKEHLLTSGIFSNQFLKKTASFKLKSISNKTNFLNKSQIVITQEINNKKIIIFSELFNKHSNNNDDNNNKKHSGGNKKDKTERERFYNFLHFLKHFTIKVLKTSKVVLSKLSFGLFYIIPVILFFYNKKLENLFNDSSIVRFLFNNDIKKYYSFVDSFTGKSLLGLICPVTPLEVIVFTIANMIYLPKFYRDYGVTKLLGYLTLLFGMTCITNSSTKSMYKLSDDYNPVISNIPLGLFFCTGNFGFLKLLLIIIILYKYDNRSPFMLLFLSSFSKIKRAKV